MSFEVRTISVFERQYKKLIKKYPSLKTELLSLIQTLSNNPDLGTSLGNECYKVRISIHSKGKGKRGGARVITNFAVNNATVYLLTIYDKSEKENITNKELEILLKFIP